MKKVKKSRMVVKTSLFPAAKSEVFERLQGFAILSEIAYPYITFKPLDGNEDLQWEVGQSFSFKAKLLGFIPFSIHKINVLEFDEKTRIYTHEQNTYVPVWNHEIVLREMGERETEYTDRVEIYAGWKTIFIYIWANMFYAHRQRKWISILKKSIK